MMHTYTFLYMCVRVRASVCVCKIIDYDILGKNRSDNPDDWPQGPSVSPCGSYKRQVCAIYHVKQWEIV